jgi:hypothetical protein
MPAAGSAGWQLSFLMRPSMPKLKEIYASIIGKFKIFINLISIVYKP